MKLNGSAYNTYNYTRICTIQKSSNLTAATQTNIPLFVIKATFCNFTTIEAYSELTIFNQIGSPSTSYYQVDSDQFYVYEHDGVLEIAINYTGNVYYSVETCFPGYVDLTPYRFSDRGSYTRLTISSVPQKTSINTVWVGASATYTRNYVSNLVLLIFDIANKKIYHLMLAETSISTDMSVTPTVTKIGANNFQVSFVPGFNCRIMELW